MLLATTAVEDYDRFVKIFSTKGAEKRKQHGSHGATVFRDPTQEDRVWVVFDWDAEGWGSFVSDPETPGIMQEAGHKGKPQAFEYGGQLRGVGPHRRSRETGATAEYPGSGPSPTRARRDTGRCVGARHHGAVLGASCLGSASFPMVEEAPRALLAGIGLVGFTAALTLLRTGPDVSPRHLHVDRPAPGGTARRDGRRGRDGARADDERARLHLDRGLRRVLPAAARGARLRGAHDRGARREPAGRARPYRRVGLDHALRHGLGGGRRPHPAPRAPARGRPHRRPHRPAQPHRLHRRGRPPARDGTAPGRAAGAGDHRPRRLQARQRPRRPRRRRPPARRARAGVDRVPAPRRPAGALRRRRVRPPDRGHERGPDRTGARAARPLASRPVDVGRGHLLRRRVARRGVAARRRAPL